MWLNLIVSGGVILIGGGLLFLLWRSRWPGWLGKPLLVLTFLCVLEAGVAPIAAFFLKTTKLSAYFLGGKGELFARMPYKDNGLLPYAIVIGSYISIALGMLLARPLFARLHNVLPDTDSLVSFPALRAWNASLVVGVLGLLSNAYMLLVLRQFVPLREMASIRAPFTVEPALTFPFFQYARLASPFMEVGGWGMIVFSGKKRLRIVVGVLFCIAYAAIQMIFGSRGHVLFSFLALILVFHYGVSRIKWQYVLGMIVSLLVTQYIILISRFNGSTSLAEKFVSWIGGFVTDAVESTDFIVSLFPSKIPYLKGATILGGLSHIFPGSSPPGAKNLWIVVLQYVIGRNTSRGISGGNFPTGAEFYVNFGIPGVIVLGVLFGIIFGLVFEWQRISAHNKFALVLTIGAYITFIPGIRSRIASHVAGAMIRYFVPVTLISALTLGGRIRRYTIVSILSGMFFAIVVKLRVIFPPFYYLKYVSLLSLAFLYYIGFEVLIFSDRFVLSDEGE